MRALGKSRTFKWSSSSAPPLACNAGAPSVGGGTRLGGGWNALKLGRPLSMPEKYTFHDAWTDLGSCRQILYISST